MCLDSHSGYYSIARSRAEALAGQTEMSQAKVAMTLAEAFKTTPIHRVAGRTGDRTAFVTSRPCHVPHHTMSDVGLIGSDHVPMPGDVSLAQNGVLFPDAWSECRAMSSRCGASPLRRISQPYNFLCIPDVTT
jgi:hypothetical protein